MRLLNWSLVVIGLLTTLFFSMIAFVAYSDMVDRGPGSAQEGDAIDIIIFCAICSATALMVAGVCAIKLRRRSF
ncbi:hypothetical protein ACSBOB_05805 [Mesorhizobium sp. ASY16-5R]|uniref:hypothetical protein n=1 Tax=Mesorhizobium sp. ASY16-5R TaxID=3445772 RepID=UPI003F9F950E